MPSAASTSSLCQTAQPRCVWSRVPPRRPMCAPGWRIAAAWACTSSALCSAADDVRDIPVDHPTLFQGWWAVESGDATLRRWTDGDAVLPLPEMAGPTMLEVRASSAGLSYPMQPVREVRAA